MSYPLFHGGESRLSQRLQQSMRLHRHVREEEAGGEPDHELDVMQVN